MNKIDITKYDLLNSQIEYQHQHLLYIANIVNKISRNPLAKKPIIQRLPINKVCGMEVDMMMIFYKTRGLLYIYSKHISFGFKRHLFFMEVFNSIVKEKELRFNDIWIFYHRLYDLLTHIRFNRYTGEMNNIVINSNIGFFNRFSNIKGVELNYLYCSVCFEPTKTKTSCEHILCFTCWNNIKIKKQSNNILIPCPICRKNLYTISICDYNNI